jgi:hypothetical protein
MKGDASLNSKAHKVSQKEPVMIDTKKARRQASEMDRGPFGDARPDNMRNDHRANASRPQEKVEDRENVSIVTPDDYPLEDRQISRPD